MSYLEENKEEKEGEEEEERRGKAILSQESVKEINCHKIGMTDTNVSFGRDYFNECKNSIERETVLEVPTNPHLPVAMVPNSIYLL